MKRITYRQADYRARFTKEGNQMYCSTQATTDTIAKYEELLEQLGYVFDDNSAEVNESNEIYGMMNDKQTYNHAILNDSAAQEKPNKDHYPKVINGWWFVYDPLVGGFVSTEIKAQETDE